MNWRAELGAAGLFVGVCVVVAIWWLGFIVVAEWALERVSA